MGHLPTLFLTIIYRRVYKIGEERIADTQFSFMIVVDTRDTLQVVFQRCRDVHCNIYNCFVDYEKGNPPTEDDTSTDRPRNRQ